MTNALVHGIDRETGDHLCGAPGGVGTDALNPYTPITCVPCVMVLRPQLPGEGGFALVEARLIAAGYDPECVTWVCEEHRRHCTVMQEPHEEHRCYWCDDPDED